MTILVPGPAYRVHTRRLIVRCWDPADAPLLRAAVDASLDHLSRWMPWAQDGPKPVEAWIETLRQFRGNFDLGRDFVYGILDRDESRVLGGTGLHTRAGEGALEIGYWIHVEHVGQGLATEAAAALTRVAFEINRVERVEIHCDPANVRSAAVPRKLGFAQQAMPRQPAHAADGEAGSSMICTLSASAYPASPAAQAAIEAFDAIGRRIL